MANRFSFCLLIFLLLFLYKHVNCELIQHSYQSESLEHGLDVVHKDHRTHLAKSPHLTDHSDGQTAEHQSLEFIEIPDSVPEIALKAKTYTDAQNFAKKFGFKNLGRVSSSCSKYLT